MSERELNNKNTLSFSPTPVKKSHIGKLYSEKAKKGVGGDAGIKTRFFEQIETSPQNTILLMKGRFCMFKLIKEYKEEYVKEITPSIEDKIKEYEEEFEKELDNMLENSISLNPLINEVKAQQWKIDKMSSSIFDNIVKIDSIEKKVNTIIEYLEKEQKRKK